MIKFLKEVLVLLVLLLPALALGHEGHGVPGTITHDVQHASWLVFAAVVVLAAALAVLSAWGQDDDDAV